MADQMGDVLRAVTGGGRVTVSAKGLDCNAGIVALVASMLSAALTFAESTGALAWNRGTLLRWGAFAAGVGGAAVVYAVSEVGGPIDLHFGLPLAGITGVAATLLAWRRLWDFDRRRRASG